MSSDEEEQTTPVLPRDSDRGSSVSSELQDEYEEMLRHAVITPKLEMFTSAKLKHASTAHFSGEDPTHSREDYTMSQHLCAEMEGQPSSRACKLSEISSHMRHAATERSRPRSSDPLESAVSEIFISDANINKMEGILDTWSHELKSKVLAELRKWKLSFMEKHKQELLKERSKCEAQTAALKSELDGLNELLNTYETSNQRKDEVIGKLHHVLDKHREQLEMTKVFSHWRLRHAEAKEGSHASQTAQHHYQSHLKKKVWSAWRSSSQRHWKDQVEKACRMRAEAVCARLSEDYETKLAEHCETLERAQAEIHRLRLERDKYEESVKKAFMRGVCALNMETLGMFSSTEEWQEHPTASNQHDHLTRDDPLSSSMPNFQPYPNSSVPTRLSPVHFDHRRSLDNDVYETVGLGAHMSQEEVISPTMVVHSSLPIGGIASSHKQVRGRVVTTSQQKPTKTVTARITARANVNKVTTRTNLSVIGVAPPMSSVVVERHHPVTQLTMGHATAARFPYSHQKATTTTKGSTRTQTTKCQVHSLKIVE